MRNRIALSALLIVLLAALVAPAAAQEDTGTLTQTVLGTYETGAFDEGAAEIAAYHAPTQTLYVVNGNDDTIDLIDISDPTSPTLSSQIEVSAYGDGANSVAIFGDLIAVAVEADPSQDNGSVVFFTAPAEFVAQIGVGALPDMVTFTPDGTKVLTANEGEPNDDYSVDPEGSVSIVDITNGVENAVVYTAAFTEFNADGERAEELPADVRIYGPGSSVAQDLEPEYIAVSADGATAYVTLQENNAVAVIDIATAEVTVIVALGFKDHSATGNKLDVNGDDDVINIANWPVLGMYQPDAIAAYSVDGETYLVTANEGDAREYEDAAFEEEVDAIEQTLDADAFPNAEELQTDIALGNLEVSNINADTDGDGDFDVLYALGARSFSIWNSAGELVYDSGADFERITAAAYPTEFNSSNDENGDFDGRSDNKGPEPEGVVLGTIGESTYAFIGLERIGGVMVYNITDPTAPVFVTYFNNRDFEGDAEAGTAGDLGPEGLVFIPAEDSPNGETLLVTSNEVSGTVTVHQLNTAE